MRERETLIRAMLLIDRIIDRRRDIYSKRVNEPGPCDRLVALESRHYFLKLHEARNALLELAPSLGNVANLKKFEEHFAEDDRLYEEKSKARKS